MGDWQPGDLALCVHRNAHVHRLHRGGIYTVERVVIGKSGPCAGVTGLMLRGLHCPDTTDGWYAAFGFRKIRPHTPDAEDIRTIALLNGKKEPVDA